MNQKHNAHSAKKEKFIKPSSACAPHGRALKRFQTREAKPANNISVKISKKLYFFSKKRYNIIKERAKDYAERHPGLYSLEKIEKVSMYSTEVKKHD